MCAPHVGKTSQENIMPIDIIKNIHFGKAEIVRFLEHVLGRISGKYLPGDPLSYRIRIKKRSNDKPAFVHQNKDNNDFYHGKSEQSATKNLKPSKHR
jgi:protein involved in sex pheromone biosynthesis